MHPAVRLTVCIVAGSLAAGSFGHLQARPQYRTAYRHVYPDDKRGGTMKCLLCHMPGDDNRPDTKRRNSYGRKLQEELGEKNVKDQDRIREALRKIGPFPGKGDDGD